MLLILFIIILTVALLFTIVGALISAPKYRGPVSDHFDGKRFINPGGIKASGLSDVFKWMFTRKRTPWKEIDAPPGPRPLAFFKDGIRITFVNHSTFLIQVDGVNILTDPVWSKRVSPFAWAGPKRMRPPGIRLEDLPRIHFVLLSHNHYDHLDIQTMRVIQAAHHPKIVTPLGVKAYLDVGKIAGATDLDWWDNLQLTKTISIQSVPAQHFSGRGNLDRDATLWCGYVLETPSGKIYFAGDTGYNENTFKEIGEKFQSFDVSFIPIGAFKPRWFMSPIHIDPQEAVKIHQEVKSKLTIACHFGTFPLGDEGKDDPKRELEKSLVENGVNKEEFLILEEGQSKDIPGSE